MNVLPRHLLRCIARGLATFASVLALLPALAASAPAQSETIVYVELNSPAPVVVARHAARQKGLPFDAELHRASIRLAQDELMGQLTGAGASFRLLSSSIELATGATTVPNRYTDLINAVRLAVTPEHVAIIRANSKVKHVSVETPRHLFLNRSTDYIRATGADSARSRGFRGTGTLNADGSASGQVVAVLDTGIDQTNPMFDSTKPDEQFDQRLGDPRPPRLAGQPYVAGVHHPKVGYRAAFSGQPYAGDDNGHGTQSASTAAGMKARTDTGLTVEGVAPGALLMDYKICPTLLCLNELIMLSLEDAARETDLAGFPKPKATVVNMSFGDCSGDPYAPDAIAAGNLMYEGVVPVASAGNLDTLRATLCDDHNENTIGSPAAGRLVMAAGASLDPGLAPNSIDVLTPDGGGVLPDSRKILATFAPESNGTRPVSMPVSANYVYAGEANTVADVPDEAAGRICLTRRGTAPFGAKVQNCTAKGAIAVVIFNNVPGEIGVATAPGAIPAFTISLENGEYLLGLGFNGKVSAHPLRINPADASLFTPSYASWSAHGPNNDFLVLKPDIIAPGEDILMGTAKANTPTGFTSASGTSFSGPHITGTAALVRDPDVGRTDFPPSLVRAALMNSATNMRERDNVTPVPDDHRSNFIHAVGAGLVDMVRAVSVKAVMGTNELNGTGGSDDPRDPNFLPSYSFGRQPLIGTNLPASDLRQQRSVTVTLADISGAGGAYTLSLVDGGALRGDITRPLGTTGFNLSLSTTSVSVPANGRATFRVTTAVDGGPSGLAIAGADDDGLEGTDFTWYVVARRSDGSEVLRMPFYYRAARGVPGGGAVATASGRGWMPTSTGKGQFSFAADQAGGGSISYRDQKAGVNLNGSVSSMVVDGFSAAFGGPCTLDTGASCEYTVVAQDNADPGKGADRFRIEVTTANGGVVYSAEALLGSGNISVSQ